MLRSQTVFLFIVSAWLVTGCGVVPRSGYRPVANVPEKSTTTDSSPSGNAEENRRPEPAMIVSTLNEAKASLMQAYREWKGTPYLLGGDSKNGIDCSRLVDIVFDDYFGIELPNHTRSQLNAGESVRRAAIKAGDLVFFRTGRKTLHVGVAVNRGEFLHASTSNGVMISKLGNSYWRSRFLEARRVL